MLCTFSQENITKLKSVSHCHFFLSSPEFHVLSTTLEGQKITSVEIGVLQKAQSFWLCLFYFAIFHLWRCQASPMQKWKGPHPAHSTWVTHSTFSSGYQLTKSQLVVAHRWQEWDTKWGIEASLCTEFLFLHACLEQGILQMLQCGCSLQSLGM